MRGGIDVTETLETLADETTIKTFDYIDDGYAQRDIQSELDTSTRQVSNATEALGTADLVITEPRQGTYLTVWGDYVADVLGVYESDVAAYMDAVEEDVTTAQADLIAAVDELEAGAVAIDYDQLTDAVGAPSWTTDADPAAHIATICETLTTDDYGLLFYHTTEGATVDDVATRVSSDAATVADRLAELETQGLVAADTDETTDTRTYTHTELGTSTTQFVSTLGRARHQYEQEVQLAQELQLYADAYEQKRQEAVEAGVAVDDMERYGDELDFVDACVGRLPRSSSETTTEAEKRESWLATPVDHNADAASEADTVDHTPQDFMGSRPPFMRTNPVRDPELLRDLLDKDL